MDWGFGILKCVRKILWKTEVTVREDEFELAVMLQERIE